MKRKYEIALVIIGILLVISSTMCSSYAYWRLTAVSEDVNVVSTGCLNLELIDTKSGVSTSINLENTFPLDELIGKSLEPYELTLTNDCTIAAKYNLLLVTDNDNTLLNNYIRYYLTDTINDIGDGLLTTLPMTNEFNGSMFEELESKGISLGTTYELTRGVLNPNASITYNLRLWVDSNATNNEMSKEFKASVLTYYEATSIAY